MKKKDLIQPGSQRQTQLISMAREINEREDTIQSMKEKTLAAAHTWIAEVCPQGQSLLKAKSLLTHGLWMDWLRIHCPNISQWTANAYMRVAANLGRIPNLEESVSLRAALALCVKQGDPVAKPAKSWPPYLEALGRVSKFTALVTKNPLADWPQEGRDKLREELEPVVVELWPEEFSKGESKSARLSPTLAGR
jgi:hypothetical protein